MCSAHCTIYKSMLNGYIYVGLGVKFILAKRFSCRLVSLVNRVDFKKYSLKYYNPTTLLIFSWIMLLCYGMFYVRLGFRNIFASINSQLLNEILKRISHIHLYLHVTIP